MNKRKSSSANLENKKIIFLEIGFVLALAAILFSFEYKSYDKIIYDNLYESNYHEDELISPIILKKQEKIPEKPKSFMVLNIVPDDNITEETEIFDPTIDFEEPLEPWEPNEEVELEIEEILPYYKVETKPVFPGGESAMLSFVARNFKLPRIDLEQGVSGKIFIAFTISAEGQVTNARIHRGIAPASDTEALRVVNMMPNWEPGVQGIRKVAVDFVLPIKVSIR
ncbi:MULTISPECIES: energy transducer TonB [unclassified Lentimicrobium]|uniref:energy transducer TonB n=1 Tax=unclassified Lentimicrobium TaxID=2677434 RepID=UPI0015569F5C|nr:MULTISPECIES: energy transducer TonB [unclassified Lentimicrobium]NPD47448.1 hypothetical protein [Lentimicrobium sp. S6]NPD86330.1 hypothetical protein [Lentimicrobium sp. L6]